MRPRPTPDFLYQQYVTEGLSARELAEYHNVSTSCIYNWLRSAGIERRSFSEAKSLTMSRKSLEERIIGTTAATATLFGKKWPHERLCRRAKTFEENAHLSTHEETLFEALGAVGLVPTIALAVDIFNIDLAFPELKLAIEVNGGGWHEYLDKAYRRDTKKRVFLESNGWKILYIRTRGEAWVSIAVCTIRQTITLMTPTILD